jgi:hypothetical protein
MIYRFLLVSAFLISLCVPALANAGDEEHSNISLFYGEMSLDTTLWKPVDKQSAYGVTFDFNPGGWPVNLMGGFSASNKSEKGRLYVNHGYYSVTAEGKTMEFSLGLRKYLIDTGAVRPYLSAGFSNISAEVSVKAAGYSVSETASSTGYFGNAGIMLLMDRFNVGFDYMILAGTSIKMGGVSGDANYGRWAVTAGMSF